jgi:hypothetical protein
MKATAHRRWMMAGLVGAIFMVWALLAAIVIANQGDVMIGFHPVILSSVPGAIGGFIVAVHLLVFRKWQIGSVCGIGALALLLVILNAQAIQAAAWRHTMELHALGNQKALAAIQLDLPPDNLSAVWEGHKLSPLENFQWSGANHLSAPKGVYFGFKVDRIPHVRIQKIRSGWRGVAFIPPETNLGALQLRTGITYAKLGTAGWFIWTL